MLWRIPIQSCFPVVMRLVCGGTTWFSIFGEVVAVHRLPCVNCIEVFVVYNFEEFTAERVYVNFCSFHVNSWHASYKICKFVWVVAIKKWDFILRRVSLKKLLDCSQSPIFSWDRLDIPRLTVTGILIFKGTKSSLDTRARWQPVTQSARSRWSYGK